MKQTIFYNTNKIRQVELTIMQFGWEKCEPNYSFGPYVRDFHMIHFIVAGKGKFVYKGKEVYLQKNQGFIIMQDDEAFYQADTHEPWEYYWIGFKGSNALNYIERAGLNVNDKYVFDISDENILRMKQVLSEIMDCDPDGIAGEIFALGCLYRFLGILIENNYQLENIKEKDDFLLKLVYFIDKNLNECNVAELAVNFNMDRTSLYRLVKQKTGFSPKEFIIDYRLQKALKMMVDGNSSLSEIAYCCGFNNYSYFCKLFKGRYHISPKMYLKNLYSANRL